MTNEQRIERADKMMREAAQLATAIFKKAQRDKVDPRSDSVQNELNTVWRPAYEAAVNYAAKYGISKHQLEYR